MTNDLIIALVGNKVDLEDKRKINKKEGEIYAEENDLIFMEVSAKENINIEELFKKIGRQIPKLRNRTIPLNEFPNIETNNLENNNNCCKIN